MEKAWISRGKQANTHLRLELLGSLTITLGGQPLQGLTSRKALALLCYLAVTGRPHSRSVLAGLLWPDILETNARTNLRKEMARLNRTLRSHLRVSRAEIAFDSNADYWLDVEEFSSLVESRTDVNRLAAGVALFRGDFLQGFDVLNAPTFEDWMLIQRAQLHEQVLQALHWLSSHFSDNGDYETAIGYVRQLLTFDPWREDAQCRLMELLARCGQRSAALAQYEICCRVLAEELDVDPAPETIDLYQRIRSGDFGSKDAGQLFTPTFSAVSVAETSAEDASAVPAYLDAEFPASKTTTPFVLRDHELSVLNGHLDAALDGKSGIVFVVGEAGSGKTALARKFIRRAQEQQGGLIVLSGTCSVIAGVGDPYLPWREVFAMLTGDVEAKWIAGAISREHALRLWRFAPQVAQALVELGPALVGALASGRVLVNRTVAGSSDGSSWQVRLQTLVERTTDVAEAAVPKQAHIFEQVTSLLTTLSQQRPILIVLDDLHWADASSIGLLFHLSRHIGNSRILIVGAYRPEDLLINAREATTHPHLLQELIYELTSRRGDLTIDLNRRDEAEERRFVNAFLDIEPNRLSETFRETLTRYTGGQALFTVELLRDLQHRGDLIQDETGYWIEGPTLDWTNLPAQVEGVIGKRLDRLSPESRLALSVASVEGEEFTAEVVAKVLGVDIHGLVRRLSSEIDRQHRLVTAQGIRRYGRQRLFRYRFQHNLFQRYLYDELDEIEQVALHEAVGNVLETLHAENLDEVAAQLAWHFGRAGIHQQAIAYLSRAGRYAIRKSAFDEALVHLRHGLALLDTSPAGVERDRAELALQTALGASLYATHGPASFETWRAYVRAEALCRTLKQPVDVPILQGLANVYMVRGQPEQAYTMFRDLLGESLRSQNRSHLVIAYYGLGVACCWMGEFVEALGHLQQTIAYADPERRRLHTALYGQDSDVVARVWLAFSLWFLGYPAQALTKGEESLALAQELDHPHTLAYVLTWYGKLHELMGDASATLVYARQAMALSEEHNFPLWHTQGLVHHGWALSQLGHAEAGLSSLQEGMQAHMKTGALAPRPWHLALLAMAYGVIGDIEQGLAALDEAIGFAEDRRILDCQAERFRLKGELTLRLGSGAKDQAAAEVDYRRAIEIARSQQAKSLELRATMSLARLWRERGNRVEAQQALAEVYDWFTEGFDTPDLRAAKGLLDLL